MEVRHLNKHLNIGNTVKVSGHYERVTEIKKLLCGDSTKLTPIAFSHNHMIETHFIDEVI